MIMKEQQSNDGDEAWSNDGNRLINSSVGNKEGELMQNRHLRVNGLNDKKLKVVSKEKENSSLQDNGLNVKNSNIVEKGEKVVRNEMENRHLRVNGLNDKILNVGGRTREKENENRHLRVNGLNNKIIETSEEWNGSRAGIEADRKFQERIAAE